MWDNVPAILKLLLTIVIEGKKSQIILLYENWIFIIVTSKRRIPYIPSNLLCIAILYENHT